MTSSFFLFYCVYLWYIKMFFCDAKRNFHILPYNMKSYENGIFFINILCNMTLDADAPYPLPPPQYKYFIFSFGCFLFLIIYLFSQPSTTLLTRRSLGPERCFRPPVCRPGPSAGSDGSRLVFLISPSPDVSPDIK